MSVDEAAKILDMLSKNGTIELEKALKIVSMIDNVKLDASNTRK